MATDTKLQELVINTMTKAQYDALATKDPNGIYAVTDAKTGAQDLDTTNAGAAGQVLTKTDGGMEWADAAGDSLPEQTGHTGFLQTDGTNATWSDVTPVSSNAEFRALCSNGGSYTLSKSLICLRSASGVIGPNVINSSYGFTIGGGQSYVFGNVSGAIHLINKVKIVSDRTLVIGLDGDSTEINVPNSILMGTENGKYYKVLDGITGFFPSERLAAAGTTGQILSKTDTGMEWVDAASGASLPLLTPIFVDHQLKDVSYLNADTFSWQAGSVYEAAYQHLADDMETATSKTDTISGITITYYQADDGHKICLPDQEASIISLYEQIGVAWYYILDTENARFKLPRTKFGITGLRDSVGAYVPAGLPNITGHFYGQNAALTGGRGAFLTGSNPYGGTVSTGNENNQMVFDASRSSAVYGNSNTVQPRATQMYLYFYVGNFTKTATENTAGLNAELFNNKADLNLMNTATNVDFVTESQLPTAANGYTWYRKYKSGWVEQGGLGQSQEGTTDKYVVLPVKMADNQYTFLAQAILSSDNQAPYYTRIANKYTDTAHFFVYNLAASTVAPTTDNPQVQWAVYGKAAQ